MRLALALLLLAAPLGAQQQSTTLVPDINVNLPPLEITNEITVMSDSAMIVNLAENNRLLREMLLADRECDTCGGANRTTKIAVAVLIPVLAWIAWEIRGLKNATGSIPGEPGQDGSDGQDGQDGQDGKHDHGHDDDDHYGESD